MPAVPAPRGLAAVIFDFDDTLATMARYEREVGLPAVRRHLLREGFDEVRVDRWCSLYARIGGGMVAGSLRIRTAFDGLSAQRQREVHDILWHDAFRDPLPGSPELLSGLRRLAVPSAVVSNTPRHRLDPAIQETGLGPLLDAVVSSSDVGAKKPDPAGILRALDLLGIPPERRGDVVYVGNRPHDVAAAEAAGIRGWLVGFGIPRDAVPPEMRRVLDRPCVEYFSDLATLAQRLAELAPPTPAVPAGPSL